MKEQMIKVEFMDRSKKLFPCDTYHPNFCSCLKISKEGLEDIHLPLVNVKSWSLVNRRK